MSSFANYNLSLYAGQSARARSLGPSPNRPLT